MLGEFGNSVQLKQEMDVTDLLHLHHTWNPVNVKTVYFLLILIFEAPFCSYISLKQIQFKAMHCYYLTEGKWGSTNGKLIETRLFLKHSGHELRTGLQNTTNT